MKSTSKLICTFVVISSSVNGLTVNGERPNIVFIMSDDHAYQAISAYKSILSKVAPTPNIDKIAQKGMLFSRAFVENSISTPSRATMLTGMYSHHHGQTHFGFGLDTTKTFFPQLLQQAGYTTAIFGKWHLNAEPKGFDYYDIFNDQGDYYNPEFRTPQTQGKYVQEEGYATTLTTQHALRWLEQRTDKKQPFCLLIHNKAPHRNFMPDLKYLETFEGTKFPEPPTLFDNYATRGSQMQTNELTISKHMGYAFDFKVEELKDEPILQYIIDSWPLAMDRLTPEQRKIWDESYARNNREFLLNRPTGDELVRWKYQRYIKDYCRTIKSIDDEVGKVLKYLKENGLEENTIIVYTSDQGFLLGEHGLYDKRFMYEESFRTPLLIAYPAKIKPHQSCAALVQNIDFAPTLLDLAGVEVPKSMDGVSLKPLLENPKFSPWRKELYYQYYDYPTVGRVRKHYGLRTDRYKLIRWYGKGVQQDQGKDLDNWELFDLKADPLEMNNVFNNKKYVSIQKKLMEELEKKRVEIGCKE